MLLTTILMAAAVGQTGADGERTGPVLSEVARKAQTRALAEFRANQHTIPARLAAYYELENERLVDRIHTLDLATARVWNVTTGTSMYEAGGGTNSGLSSVPVTGETPSGRVDPASMTGLRRDNFLLKGRLRDSRFLYRQSNQVYRSDYPIRVYRAIYEGR
jgi:hypothetical protein